MKNWHDVTMTITQSISAAQNKARGDLAASKGDHEEAAYFLGCAFRDAESAVNYALRFLDWVETLVKAETRNGSLIFDITPNAHQELLHGMLFFWEGRCADAIIRYTQLGMQTGQDAAGLRTKMKRLHTFSGVAIPADLCSEVKHVNEQLKEYENQSEV